MNSNSIETIVDKIFTHDIFNSLDKNALIDKYNITDDIEKINAAFGSKCKPKRQTSNTISSIPPEGIVIKKPGLYTFTKNITWESNSEACAAITIEADDVVLDLCNYGFTATIQDSSVLISGIYIKNVANVIVMNGTLVDMCFYGIRAEEVKNLTLEKLTISGLVFNNLNIRNLCPAGIHINHVSDVTITDCIVQYMYVTADSSAGIQLLNSFNGSVNGCQVNHLVNYDGSVQGYSYIGVMDVKTSNCRAENFQSHFNGNIRTMGHTVLGFIPIFCLGLSYESCSSTNMIGCSDDCHGMSIFLNAGVKVNKFKAKSVTDGVTPSHTGAKATGLEVYGVDISISNCSAEDIKAINPQDKQSTGFSTWGTAIRFTDCKASKIIVCDEYGIENSALGYGTGFGWAPDPRPFFRDIGAYKVEYIACQASNCHVAFDTWFHIDSTWENVSYKDCDIDILVQPGESRTLSGNPASECNPPITVVINNIAQGNTYPGS